MIGSGTQHQREDAMLQSPGLRRPYLFQSPVHQVCTWGPCHCHARWTGGTNICARALLISTLAHICRVRAMTNAKDSNSEAWALAAGVIVNKLKEASSNRESADVSSAKKSRTLFFLLHGWPKGKSPAQEASIARLMTNMIPLLTPSSEYGSRQKLSHHPPSNPPPSRVGPLSRNL